MRRWEEQYSPHWTIPSRLWRLKKSQGEMASISRLLDPPTSASWFLFSIGIEPRLTIEYLELRIIEESARVLYYNDLYDSKVIGR